MERGRKVLDSVLDGGDGDGDGDGDLNRGGQVLNSED